ncbi:hypothetical protein XFF6166_90014 [Xanthomonas citri pv. fuscans]|nr:hypothetical protein XFF6166_90014 [Xanthomonas citri pv. fuscans]SOO03862.1 hypothetical protein XFF7767_20005 [Xanthomonas citri pv. fuscans]SOO03974.1 hypothetical protein XFF6960_900006 [Xanthomonas citri pv. fuscans]SOO16124.1 hypothetical protein XFF7766_750005 [Xanthomonas citri pv. fuscans]SOO44124.1 hypothetical protein XFF1815_440007 [Xanthomonas citri pv. fuscans]
MANGHRTDDLSAAHGFRESKTISALLLSDLGFSRIRGKRSQPKHSLPHPKRPAKAPL